jgi:hypothetical protein
VRAAGRPVAQPDPVLLAAAAQRLALELRGVVGVQLERLAAHRPHRVHFQPLQPGPLVGRRVRQAQPDRGRRRGLQRHRHPDHEAARHVDRGREVRAPDRQPVLFVDHDHVDWGVVRLDLLEQPGDLRRDPACGLQRPGSVLPLSRRRRPHRVEHGDAAQHGAPRRHPQAAGLALPRDLPAYRGRRPALPRQVPGPQDLTDHRFHVIRQPSAAATAARSAGQQVRDKSLASPPAADQHVDLPPGNAQAGGSRGGILQAHHALCGESPDHAGPASGQVPRPRRRGQHAALCHHRVIGHSGAPQRPPCTRVRNKSDRSAGDSGTRRKPEVACTQAR